MGEIYTYVYNVGSTTQYQQTTITQTTNKETPVVKKKQKAIAKRFSIEEIEATENMSIGSLFKRLIRNKKDTVGPTVYYRQKRCLELVKEFNSMYFNRVTVYPVEIKQAYCFSFKEWLLQDKKFEMSYVRKTIQIYKQVLDLAVSYELTQFNHFAKIKFKIIEKPIKYLSIEDVNKLKNKTLTPKYIERFKNMFLMQCYTGLAFADLFTLKVKNIDKQEDGSYWIRKERCKTSVLARIPLCKDAMRIILEFADCPINLNKTTDNESFIFRYSTNQKYNVALKRITKELGFETPLTSHMGRKTFAMGALNSGTTSIETVSAMLGHANTKITQKVYAKVEDKRILNEMKNIDIYGK